MWKKEPPGRDRAWPEVGRGCGPDEGKRVRWRLAWRVGNRRVVFNIEGHEYRLIVAIAYRLQIVYVKFIGKHQQYVAIDAHAIEPS